MKLTFLGTGTSEGVPIIACSCDVCRSKDPRDKRLRTSVWMQNETVSFVIDTTPDFRTQAIRADIQKLDAALITHIHADHIMGFDDLRRYCSLNNHNFPIYASPDTIKRITEIFPYAFDTSNTIRGYIHAEPNPVTATFQLGNIEITPLELPHGNVTTLGFIFSQNGIKRAAYLTDCGSVPDPAMEQIMDIPILILDGLRDNFHPAHLTIPAAIQISQNVRAKKTYLIHLTHEKSHVQREQEMPENIFISYDGLEIDF